MLRLDQKLRIRVTPRGTDDHWLASSQNKGAGVKTNETKKNTESDKPACRHNAQYSHI